MKTHPSRAIAIAALLMLPASAITAQDPRSVRVSPTFSAEELDNLVAPVALYPDPLLAQVLIASTFPDQVLLAARHVRERGTRDVDSQNWDLSVRAVAHYPPLLNLFYEDEDWLVALGQAYAGQSTDVMDAVQRLREMANAQGNLVTTDEQKVIVERERIVIVPANPQYIYVPTYDPGVVFFRPIVHLGFRTSFWSFGIGFPIGDWLVYDLDWYGRRVYYDGWYGGGWRHYSRPYVVLRPIYVHPRYRVVHVGAPWGRVVNYYNLEFRHRRIHQRVTWERRDRTWRPNDRAGSWRNDRGSWGNDRGSRTGPVNGPRDDRNSRPGDDRDRARGGLRTSEPARTPTLGTQRPTTAPASTRERKVQEPVNRGGMLGSVVKTRPQVESRQPVTRGGLVVTPRAQAPKANSRPQATTRSSPPVIRPSTKPATTQRRATVTAPRPTVRVQTAKPAVKSQSRPASTGSAKVKPPARAGSGSGKGKGGGK